MGHIAALGLSSPRTDFALYQGYNEGLLTVAWLLAELKRSKRLSLENRNHPVFGGGGGGE
eukprot:150866-Rhodomonas_salina.1